MKKTNEEIEKEINQHEEEILNNPLISEDVKDTLRSFRELYKKFPDKVNKL